MSRLETTSDVCFVRVTGVSNPASHFRLEMQVSPKGVQEFAARTARLATTKALIVASDARYRTCMPPSWSGRLEAPHESHAR